MVFDNGLCGLQQDRRFRFCANLFSCYLLTTVICGRMVEEILSTVPIEVLVDDLYICVRVGQMRIENNVFSLVP